MGAVFSLSSAGKFSLNSSCNCLTAACTSRINNFNGFVRHVSAELVKKYELITILSSDNLTVYETDFYFNILFSAHFDDFA